MSEQKSEGQARPEFDPAELWIEFYNTWSKSWADAMSKTTASKGFAESMGQQLESSLDALTLVRRQVNELMEQYLQSMSLPTRGEVLSLAERLVKIEMRLDDLDAKLDEALDYLKALPATPSEDK